MLLMRTLHPSGHGAFFTERISQEGKDDFIVVYDCGATEDKEKELLEKEINGFFQKGNTIDILFISHFDRDHVSGIEQLKPYITNTTKLVMPFSYEYFYLPKNAPTLLFMSMVMGIVADKAVEVCWVRYTDFTKFESSHSLSPTLDGADMKAGFLESGIRIGCGLSIENEKRYKWIYVPFNLYDDKIIREKFEKEVADKLGKEVKDISAPELDDKVLEQLREIYKNLGPYKTKDVNENTRKANESKNINYNSLIVLSKSTEYTCFCDCDYSIRRLSSHKCGYCDGSCLYTGDSNLKQSDNVQRLIDVLAFYTELPICLFQLPHHGSCDNYGKCLLRSYDLYINVFVNCGERDFKKKTFPNMLADVKKSGRNLIKVMGKKYCRLEQRVYVR